MQQAKEILKEYEKATNEFAKILSSFTQEELNIVPFEGSWTAGQVGRHLFRSYEFVPQLLQGPVQKTERAPDMNIENIKAAFLDFTIKLKSPSFIIPEEIIYEKEELLTTFKNKAAQIITAANDLDLSETCTGFDWPVLGYLTRLEVIFFGVCHAKRHAHQLEKIYRVLAEKVQS
jgi:hypothetical protein